MTKGRGNTRSAVKYIAKLNATKTSKRTKNGWALKKMSCHVLKGEASTNIAKCKWLAPDAISLWHPRLSLSLNRTFDFERLNMAPTILVINKLHTKLELCMHSTHCIHNFG